MNTSIEEFLEQFKFGLVEVVFEWARGMPFYEITQLTDVQEGRVLGFLLCSFINLGGVETYEYLGSVVRRPDSAIHWIAIFSTFVKLAVDRYNLRLRFGWYL